MIWVFLLKEWKGMIAGGSVALVLALMGMGSMYSVIQVQSGSISKLESKVDGLKTRVSTCNELRVQDKVICEAVAKASKGQQASVEEWREKHEESVARFNRYTRLAEERDAEALRYTEEKDNQTSSAIKRAQSAEGKVRAFATGILGEASEY